MDCFAAPAMTAGALDLRGALIGHSRDPFASCNYEWHNRFSDNGDVIIRSAIDRLTMTDRSVIYNECHARERHPDPRRPLRRSRPVADAGRRRPLADKARRRL